MAHLGKSVGRSISAAMQIAAVFYFAVSLWLATGWMAHDEWAASASTQDWWWEAARRFGFGLVCAAVIGLFLWWLNSRLSRFGLTFSGVWTRAISWASFGLIAMATAFAAVGFAIDKPYM